MSQTLDEFFAARDWNVIEAATGWKVVRDGANPHLVRLHLSAKDGQAYIVLFVNDGYSQAAPSVAFINDEGSKVDPKAWPTGTKEFLDEVKPPPHAWLCMPWTREGLAAHAVDWSRNAATDCWDGDRHTLMDLFNRMQRMLNGPYYTRRGA